jgi:hypothetical protein
VKRLFAVSDFLGGLARFVSIPATQRVDKSLYRFLQTLKLLLGHKLRGSKPSDSLIHMSEPALSLPDECRQSFRQRVQLRFVFLYPVLQPYENAIAHNHGVGQLLKFRFQIVSHCAPASPRYAPSVFALVFGALAGNDAQGASAAGSYAGFCT